jgi:NADPH-dependent 7-cyano-7-deazaguanine reductase QueF
MSSEVLVVDSHALVRVEITARVTKLCPFKDEVDHGAVTIQYLVRGKTLELHALRALLDGYASVKATHEDFAYELTERITELVGGAVFVLGAWETAGMEVEVSASTASE